jgi:hypothetical protein
MAHEAGTPRPDWRRVSLAAFLYLLVAAVFFARGLLGHHGYYIGRETDPPQTMWFFKWWMFSIAHGYNSFLTDWVWAPLGINLAWTAFVPIPAWLSIPLQVTVGEPATYNVITTLMPPLAALAAFLLCRRITGAFWPSVLGGYIFGFSSYMLDELQRHLNLLCIFPVPLAVLVVLKKLDAEMSSRRYAIALAALLVVQFLCSVELFTTVTVFGFLALLLAAILFGPETRTRLAGLVAPTIVAYLINLLVLSPYLYYLLEFGTPHSPIWEPGRYSADLAGLFVPRQTIGLGSIELVAAVARRCAFFQNSDYVGIVVLALIEVFRRRYWPVPAGRLLTLMLLAIVVAAMGPALHFCGRSVLPMPWAIVKWLPLISIALPMRLMMYAFLVIAIMAAMWFASSAARPATKWIAAALILLSIAPNPFASFWVSRLDLPAFFADGAYATELEPREVILPLPWGERGNSMYWQLQSDMYFRMAGGYTGEFAPFEFARMPVANYFYGGIDLPEPADQLKAYIARFGVQAVIADPIEPNFESFKRTLDSIGAAGLNEKGVWIYKIPGNSFAAYAKLPPAQVEARANALRFDAILEAAGKYLADGRDPSKLSALELKRLDLLPHDWLVDATPHAYFDWEVGPATGGGVGIITVGSYEGVRPLIERYRGIASEIDYPAPTRWTPASHPRLDVIKPLLVTFDSAQLAAAAKSLRDSPPPERTTPFVAGVTAGLY